MLRTEFDRGDSWSVGRTPIRREMLYARRISAIDPSKNFEREMTKNASAASKPPGSKANRRVRRGKAAVLERKPVSGWATSDEDEIDLRRWRGSTEVADVVALDPDRGFFGDFKVRSTSGGGYEVEIRSLDGLTNSCGCVDHRVNGLGTCKHIEGTLAALGAARRGRFAPRRRSAVRDSRYFSTAAARRSRPSPGPRRPTRRRWPRPAPGCVPGWMPRAH